MGASLDDLFDAGRAPASSGGASLDDLFSDSQPSPAPSAAPPAQAKSGASLDDLFSAPAAAQAPASPAPQGSTKPADGASVDGIFIPGFHPDPKMAQMFSGQNLAKGYASAVPMATGGQIVAAARPLAALMMGPLGWIQRASTSATLQAAALLHVPGAQELNQKLNPEGRIDPGILPNDITDYILDKSGQALSSQPGSMASYVRAAVSSPVTKFGVGSIANYFMDLNRLYNFGQLTQDAESLQKIGDTSPASQEKNLVTVRAPLTGKTASLPMKAVQPIADTLSNIPGVKLLASMIRMFSPDTGNPTIDRAMSVHAQLGYGQENSLKQDYLLPEAKKQYTDPEKALMFSLGENTPNLKPDVPQSIIDAADGKLSASEDQVRAQMQKILPDLAEKHGVTLVPGRDQTLIDGAINAKKWDSQYLEALVRSGHIDESNVNEKTIQNHMPHVINPAFDNEEGQEIKANLRSKGWISSADITRQRKLSGTVAEINQYVKDTYGKDNFFITDPHLAAAIRLKSAWDLERHTNLLEAVAPFGVRSTSKEGELAQKRGWIPINHQEFAEKKVTLWKDSDGNTEVIPPRGATPVSDGTIQTVRHGELLFPREVASKVQYYTNQKSMNNFGDSMGEFGKYLPGILEAKKDLNQIQRATSFTTEGFWGRNTVNNASKAIAAGTEPKRFLQAAMLMRGKDPGLTAINPETGSRYTVSDLQKIMARNGVTTSNAFYDGVSDFLDATKKLTMGQVLQNPKLGLKWATQVATNIMHKVTFLGEKGENLTRSAQVLQGLEDGFHPQDAVINMNRTQFDYRRNSPMTDAARFFFPYIQHPIKTAFVMPSLVGKNPGYWNFVSNSLPHVLAGAFHDPVTQDEINRLLPENLRMKDMIAGPFIPGNTLLASILGNPSKPGALPNMAYFNLNLGFDVMNQFDYFSQAARGQRAINNYGLSGFDGALLNIVQGHDNFGNNFNSASQSLGYLLRQGIIGNVSFPNTIKMVKEMTGLINQKDPGYEPMTLLAAKGLFSQFGGQTELAHDADVKIKSLSWLYHQTLQSGAQELKGMMKRGGDSNGYSLYASSNRMVEPMTNAQVYQEIKQRQQQKLNDTNGQLQTAYAAQAALSGKITPEDYISRLKNIAREAQLVNQSVQFAAQRYLQMASGAKSPEEARSRAGVKLYQGK